MSSDLGPLQIVPRTGTEHFHSGPLLIPATLIDFWRWSSSDLVGNTLRGVLAEYIVALALGVTSGTRVEWDSYDLKSPSGLTIEVKSSAYIQSWAQKSFYRVTFSIRPTHAYDSHTNTHTSERRRQADLYVFALLKHTDKSTIDPLDLTHWDFYLIPSALLNAHNPVQKSISLSALLRLNPAKCTFDELAAAIDSFASTD